MINKFNINEEEKDVNVGNIPEKKRSRLLSILIYMMILSVIIFCITAACFMGFACYMHIKNRALFYTDTSEIDSLFKDTVAITNKAEKIQAYLDEHDIFGVRDTEEKDILYRYLFSRYDDYYLDYYTEEEFAEDNKGSMAGIGVTISQVGDYVRITELTPGAPAERAGLKVDDVIVRYENTNLREDPLRTLTALLANQKEGEVFHLTYMRGGVYKTVALCKEEFEIVEVYHKLIDGTIPYIQITTFHNKNVSEQFEEAVKDLTDAIQKTKKLVIDLRSNGGGHADEAVDVAGYFVGENRIAVKFEEKGDKTSTLKTGTKQIIPDDIEIYILTDYGTASASELLISILQDYDKKLKLIGERTYGKGIAQNTVPVPWGGYLKFTSSLYYSPLGRNIQDVGIEPDILVFGKDEQSETLCGILGVAYNPKDFLINNEVQN